uniref:Band 7 domain-containing protein n=1 Tax=Trieres chinensis TaxID=1514140 RepID=A0A7S1ZEN3_TRICV|mmetsp:Transcript_23999/g.48571  ORF Transcript_23999/g.48571 Transcript_23999/m.48571 type:complete len:416 (+) Transcript_23999:65-1312(+)|eukprot:CAMPEP_0183308064 /NCGR_PEP_ID=MMETSP0160_2-20130417/19721_1 /TAXON_ID=2839 ORGANISM="Odontella Sinensis, Strain Grunow 1884" /NCGR_SAMPLE_ID=MMETSP0160_2 /ASSEMBLY_ACC=CAM_ASM_000250 /LENGTH=415 /DNA_ID=CAMNT_0025471809 /DNA_START=63 /DNA_END=1310 /DNA_ORIENTATION=-
MNYQGIQHSKLVQRSIRSAVNADKEFARIGANGEIPIVLIPRSALLFYFALNVPSGPFVLWQQWHSDKGQKSPGVVWFWPAWNRISHIITRATITYNAPAKDCPTADNVMVNVDLSLTFRIGPDIDAAKNFVYRLGAHRFDELLSAETEESIRGLVYSVTHDKVNDLREEFAVGMLQTLNSKCNVYGIQIMNVKITDVMLPRELQMRLERTTAFKTKMGEQEKSHENRVRVLEDEATKDLETIRKSNARKIQEISAERRRYEIERREMEERARGEARVQEVRAMTEADVALKKAQGDEVVEKVRSRQNAEALLKKTQVECQTMKIESEQRANVLIKESEAALKVAESNAAAMIAKAEAEAEGAEALAEKRRYELEWARLAVLEKIAGKGRKFITGKKGEMILNDLVPDSKVVAAT